MIDLPPPSYEQTIEAVVRCDIPRPNVRIAYEHELQSDEVTITNLGKVTDEKLRCLRAAVHPFYILTISDQAQQAAFYDFSRKADGPAELAKARQWVTANGLLPKLPVFHADQGIAVYARALEGACGLAQDSAFQITSEKWLSLRPEFMQGRSFEASARSLECLMNMFAASNAPDSGVDIGLIGNAAYSEETKK